MNEETYQEVKNFCECHIKVHTEAIKVLKKELETPNLDIHEKHLLMGKIEFHELEIRIERQIIQNITENCTGEAKA